MVSSLPPHDFLKSTDFKNNEYLNEMLAFVNSSASIFGLDITKQAVDKIPFINGTIDPQSMSVTDPTWVGYGDDIWLVVPDGSGGSIAYNMSSILKAGAIRKINNISSDPTDGEFNLKVEGDLTISNDQASHSTTVSSSAIDAKIASNKASSDKNASDIAKNASDISRNTSNISRNATNISTNTSRITDVKSDTDANTSAIATLSQSAVQNISSSDSSITVVKNGTDVDLKVASGATGTVKTVVGKSPDSLGAIGLLESDTIKEGISSDANKFALDAKISAKTGNSLQVLSGQTDPADNGLFSTGGSATGTVKTIGGVSPDGSGEVGLEETPSIIPQAGTNPNDIKFGVKLSADAGNVLNERSDGLFASGTGGGASGLDTINNIASLNKNIDLTDTSGSLTIAGGAKGVVNVGVKIDPAGDNIITTSSAGLKAVAGASGGKLDTINSVDAVNKNINLTSPDKSITIAKDSTIAGDIKAEVAVDTKIGNLLKKGTNGMLVDIDDLPLGDSAETVYFDDTFTAGAEDGSLTNPYSDIGNAISKAVELGTSTGKLHRVVARDTASNTIGLGSTVLIGDSSKAQYVWVHLHFPTKVFSATLQIDLQGKTDLGRNTVSGTFLDDSFSIDFVNKGTSADLGSQGDGINVLIDCKEKSARSDKTQLLLDMTGLTGIACQKFINYTERVGQLLERSITGTANNIVFRADATLTNFEFFSNVDIGNVDSSRVTSSGVTKVNYVDISRGLDSTVITRSSIRCSNEGRMYFLRSNDVDENTVISDKEVSVDNIIAQAKLDLPVDRTPSDIGGISYDATREAIAYKTAKGVKYLKETSASTDVIKNAVRYDIDGFIESYEPPTSLYMPKAYVSFFTDAGIADIQLEFDQHYVSARRKDVPYNNPDGTTGTYLKTKTLDEYDFSAEPSYQGIAFLKLTNISNFSVTPATGTIAVNRDYHNVDFNVTGMTDDELKANFKCGYTYTFKNPTSGKSVSVILFKVSFITNGTVNLIGFLNTGTYTNIEDDANTPYADQTAIDTDKANITEAYIGDYFDFPFNKSAMKDKTRESAFPHYYPLYIGDISDSHNRSIILVSYCSRMCADDAHTKIGQKAIINSSIPKALLSFIKSKWGTSDNNFRYQIIGIPIKAGILDDARGKEGNFCRSFLPFKGKIHGNRFVIEYYWGTDPAQTLTKFAPANVYGTKAEWSSQGVGVLDESEYFISSIVQDCPYVYSVKSAIKLSQKSNAPSEFVSKVGETDISYEADDKISTIQYGEGFFALSDDLKDVPMGVIDKKSGGSETVIINPRVVQGIIMSPTSVIIREKENNIDELLPPSPVQMLTKLTIGSDPTTLRYSA